MSLSRLTSWMSGLFWVASTMSCRSPASVATSEPAQPQLLDRDLAPSSGQSETPTQVVPSPFAVLELFTSEGCSSCPPADETLAQVTEEAERLRQRVFTLELHVDYWNQLGWADPFSDSTHSLRQQAYARRLSGAGIYTPQLVINGRAEMVGSDSSRARSAIVEQLGTPAAAMIALTARHQPGVIEVRARVLSTRGGELLLAVADDRAESHVARGENANRVLRHRHVVRAFRSIRVNATAEERVEIPWRKGSGAVFVAGYLADPATLSILGAEAVVLD